MSDQGSEYDAAIDRLWLDGLWRGDLAGLQALRGAHPAHPRAPELLAFLRVAALGDGIVEDEAWVPVGGDAATQTIDAAARMWHVTARRLPTEAEAGLRELEQALRQLPASDPRAVAARAIADLCTAETAILCDDLGTARRRLWAIIRRRVPPGTAYAARVALALRTQRSDRSALDATRVVLDDAVVFARDAGHPGDAAAALIHGGVLAALDGDVSGAVRRLELGLAEAPDAHADVRLVATVVLSGLRDDDRGFADLGRGLAAAAASGDYLGTITLLVVGSRKALALGKLADAIAILDNGAFSLEASLGRGAAAPLREARERIQADTDPATFAEAERVAAAQRVADGDRAPRG